MSPCVLTIPGTDDLTHYDLITGEEFSPVRPWGKCVDAYTLTVVVIRFPDDQEESVSKYDVIVPRSNQNFSMNTIYGRMVAT